MFMKIFSKTDTGLVRTDNQDYCDSKLINGNVAVAVVCDGMGGPSGGDIASSIAVKAIISELENKELSNATDGEIKNAAQNAIGVANSVVFGLSEKEEKLSGMGTTVVMAIIVENKAHILHAGDSRAYLYSNKDLKRLTKDHSFVQEMIDSGELDPKDAQNHPQKNIITKAVGIDKVVEAQYTNCILEKDDSIILCTDGLTNLVPDSKILDVLQNTNREKICDVLVSLAKECGGNDNITVMLIAE